MFSRLGVRPSYAWALEAASPQDRPQGLESRQPLRGRDAA
jgi:hypothetical protein